MVKVHAENYAWFPLEPDTAKLFHYAGLACLIASFSISLLTVNKRRKQFKTGLWLGAFTLAMFGFSYFLVVGFDVLCHKLGINGKLGAEDVHETQTEYVPPSPIPAKADIMVLTTNNSILPITYSFKGGSSTQAVTPGETIEYTLQLNNPKPKAYNLRVQLSVVPGTAARFVSEGEQRVDGQIFHIEPQATLEVPLKLKLSPKLPNGIRNIVLSYTFYDVTHRLNLERGEIMKLVDQQASAPTGN